eukprot:516644_1
MPQDIKNVFPKIFNMEYGNNKSYVKSKTIDDLIADINLTYNNKFGKFKNFNNNSFNVTETEINEMKDILQTQCPKLSHGLITDKPFLYLLAMSKKHHYDYLQNLVDDYLRSQITHSHSVFQWTQDHNFFIPLKEAQSTDSRSYGWAHELTQSAIQSYQEKIFHSSQLFDNAENILINDSIAKTAHQIEHFFIFVNSLKTQPVCPFQIDFSILYPRNSQSEGIYTIDNELVGNFDSDEKKQYESNYSSKKNITKSYANIFDKKTDIGAISQNLSNAGLTYVLDMFLKKDCYSHRCREFVQLKKRFSSFCKLSKSTPQMQLQLQSNFQHFLQFYSESVHYERLEYYREYLVEYCQQHESLMDECIQLIRIVNSKNSGCWYKKHLTYCPIENRHNQTVRKQRSNKFRKNTQYLFWTRLLDGLHCKMYHPLKDHSSQHAQIERVHRFNTQYLPEDMNKVDQSNTFLDRFYTTLTQQGTPMDVVKNIIIDEEYDTVSVITDLKDGRNNTSNIVNATQNTIISNEIIDYIQCSQFPRFAGGYRFFYWKYWECDDATNEQHSLFVESNHATLKDELFYNQIFTLDHENWQIAMDKATKYMQSKTVKAIKAPETFSETEMSHYGIANEAAISLEHLLSLIFYCDEDKLQCKFTATFRAKDQYESILWIKKQHSQFANFARLLRETVEIFGLMGWDQNPSDIEIKTDQDIANWNISNHRVSGPFYFGMSSVIVMEEFNIRLCGPTSTSMQVEVARQFSGSRGIVVQLNNNGYSTAHILKLFDCSWISCHPEEDERLFIGGVKPIKIESISNTKTRQNHVNFFEPLYYFHCMISGTIMDKYCKQPSIINNHYIVFYKLIKYHLKILNEMVYSSYIHNTFTAFVQHQT